MNENHQKDDLTKFRSLANTKNNLSYILNYHELMIKSSSGKVLRKPAVKQATAQANKFIEAMQTASFTDRQDFIKLIIEIYKEINISIPFTVSRKIIWPTLKEWLVYEPNNSNICVAIAQYFSEPTAFYYEKPFETRTQAYAKALELNPTNNTVREILITEDLDNIYFYLHHIFDIHNGGIILDYPHNILKYCESVVLKCKKLDQPKVIAGFINEINEAKSIVTDWLEYEKTNREIAFVEYCQSLGISHPGMRSISS